MQWVPYGQTQDEFLAHVRSMLAVFQNVNVIAGPGGYGFYMLGSDGNVELDAQALEEVLARPGVLDDVNSAPDTSGRTAADWAQHAHGPQVGERRRAAPGRGRRAADHRRPAAPGVLHHPPADRPGCPAAAASAGSARCCRSGGRCVRNRFRDPVLCSDRVPLDAGRRPSVSAGRRRRVVAGGQPPLHARGPACVRHDRSRDLGHAPRREPVGDAVLALGLPPGLVGRLRRERPRGDARRRPGGRPGRRHADRDRPAHAPPRGGARRRRARDEDPERRSVRR